MAEDKALLKTQLDKKFNMMRQEGQKWEPAWKELQTYINQTRGFFSDQQANAGKKIDHQVMLDSHATRAQKILASGLKSGMTSPERKWFKLTLEDELLNDLDPVREWLDDTRDRMLAVINNSNMYDVFYSMYEELGQFGQACCVVLEDYEDIIRGISFTCGEYYLSFDSRGRFQAFAREFWMTTQQLIDAFGEDNCSPAVKAEYNNKQYQNWHKCRNLIELNKGREEGKEDKTNMLYSSYYWEVGQGVDFLEIGGFPELPVMAPDWDKTVTNQVYGYGPGWHALGDIKQLQKTALDKLIAQEKLHSPPIQVDASVGEDAQIGLTPNGITRTSSNVPNSGVRPAYQINPNLESFIEMENSLREKIDKDFFVHLFLMLMNIDDTKMTATEVAERQQEKMMMMGPILEKIENKLLSPFLERVYAIMLRKGLFLPPPEEIQGQQIKKVYTSVLAQANKVSESMAIDRLISRASALMPIYPDALDVVDVDESLREAADIDGVPARLVRDEVELEEIRAAKRQQEQMAQAAAMAESASGTVKNLADAKTEDESVLTNLSKGMAGQQ